MTYKQLTKGKTMKVLNHHGISFRVEKYELVGTYETKVRYQCFLEELDFALGDLEANKAISIMRAIALINEKETEIKQALR
jgi:hypothetical protein